MKDYFANCRMCKCGQVQGMKICICGHPFSQHNRTIKNIIDEYKFKLMLKYYKLKRWLECMQQ